MRLFNLDPYEFKAQLITAAGGSFIQFICQAVLLPGFVAPVAFGTVCSFFISAMIRGSFTPGFSMGSCLFNLVAAATTAQVVKISESADENFNQVYSYLSIIAAAAYYATAKYTRVPQQQNEDAGMAWVRRF